MDIQRRLDNFETYLNTSTTSGLTTIRKYKNIVRLFLYDNLGKIERIDDNLEIDLNIINTWLSNKNRTKSTTHYKFAIKHLLISLGHNELSERIVPAKKLKRKKIFPFVHKSKMQDIINFLPPIYRPLAFLQVKTGARIGSIFTLRAENIEWSRDENLIYIKIGVNKTLSKRSKEHTLRISKKYEDLLRGWIERPWGFIFLDSKCESMTDEELISHLGTKLTYYNRELEKAGRVYSVDNLSSHYLRHLYSDYFMKAGGDATYLQKALGHAKLETTLRYISIQDKMVDKTIIAMEEM